MPIYGNLQFLLLKDTRQYPQSINIKCMPCVMKCLQILTQCQKCNETGSDIKMQQELFVERDENTAYFTEENTSVRARLAEWERTTYAHGATPGSPTGLRILPSISTIQGTSPRTPTTKLPSITTSTTPTTPTTPLNTHEWFISHEQKKMRKLQRDVESLQHDRFLLQEEVHKMRSELIMWRTKCEQLEAIKTASATDLPEFQQIEQENESLSMEIEKLKFQLDENKREVYESKLHVERLRIQLDDARSELLSESESKRTLNVQLEKLRILHQELQREMLQAEEEPDTTVLTNDPNEKVHYTAQLHSFQDQLFALQMRSALLKALNHRIYSQSRKAHQGHCAIMCLALDYHNELWRDVGVQIMREYISEVYECVERLIANSNGYISHMTQNEELILSFDNVHDSVEFSLSLRDELINTLTRSQFSELVYCPTVVDSNDSSVLLFKGVRFMSCVHVGYPQVRMDYFDDEIESSEKYTLQHEIYHGHLIADLQTMCRRQILPGILNLTPDAWQEISHLSLETSFTKSPLQVHEASSADAVFTCIFPRVIAECIEHIIPRAPTNGIPPRARIKLHHELLRVQRQIEIASTHLARIEEEELAREEEHRLKAEAASRSETNNIQARLLQLAAKIEDPHALWNELKPELDQLTNQLVEQSLRVQQLESVRHTLSPTKIRHLDQLRIQLERAKVRHEQVKMFMESMTNYEDRIIKAQGEIHLLNHALQQCVSKINHLQQQLQQKDEDLQQTTTEVARLQTEITLLVDREKALLSSENMATAEDELRLFKKMQLLTRKAEAVLSMDESSVGDKQEFVAHKRRDLKDFLKQSLQIQLEKSRMQCTELQKELEECRQSLKQVSALSEKSGKERGEIETALAVAQKKIVFMGQQMKRKNDEIDEWKSKVDNLQYILAVAEKKQKMIAQKVVLSTPKSPRKSTNAPMRALEGASSAQDIPQGVSVSPSSQPAAPSEPTNLSPLTLEDIHSLQTADTELLTQLSHNQDTVTFDPKTQDTSFELQNDFQSVIYRNDHVYRTLLGNTCWTNGKHSFTLHLDRASDNILVGVADMFHSSEKRAGETNQSWSISINTGSIFHSGGWKRYANRRIEKYIVVELDLTRAFEGKGTLSFVLDGFSFGAAAQNLKGALSPAVSMYHKGDQVSIV